MSTKIDSEGDPSAPMSRSTVASRRQIFLDIVTQSNTSCQNGDYTTAVTLYTEALKMDPNNHILYSNRSAAFIKLGQFSHALQDALKARELNSKWSKAYYRQGVALQCLARHADALAAFSTGLAQEPKSGQLLSGLMEAAIKSPLKGRLEGTLTQLKSMGLDKSAFVVISVVGQELLAGGFYNPATKVLESSLKIGTTNLKLKGSVLSALSSAYWAMNSLEKAISYMQQDLAVAKQLGDVTGECRAHGNLGSAYFSKGNYKEALTSHRYQLVLAMKCKDTQAASSALTSLGHVYTAIGDYSNALASHKQCVQLVKQTGDRVQEAREIGNVGAVYLVMGDFENAIDCHMEHLRIAKDLRDKVEEARAYSNLGSSYHYRRNFEQAITFHKYVLQIAQDLRDKNIETRAYAGLGHAARCMGDVSVAKMWHEKQLDMALRTKDKVSEARACSNLGIVYQLLGEHDAALKLHQAHLNIANGLNDRAGMGRAYGNIGNAYNSMGYYEQAVKYHKQELAISKEVNDRNSEASTHGNLAVAYQALGIYDKALVHYHSHLNISRELKDSAGEACALLNLGNCHSSQGDFAQAIPFYENYLMLSQELNDVEGEGKACHFLGFAHYSLGNFKEAAHYYEQDLTLAKDLQVKANISRAYCNLGLTNLALGNLDAALECQQHFLAAAHSSSNKYEGSKFRALGNIGNVLLKMNKVEEAIKHFQKQLMLAKSAGEKGYEAIAYGALGMAYRSIKRYDRALGFHTQELTLLQEINDVRGECRTHGSLGAVHMSLGNYTSAIKCYEEMLERAKELKDCVSEAQAYGNLGIARINMGSYEEAARFFESQIAILEPLLGVASGLNDGRQGKINSALLVEKARAYSNLGCCYSALHSHEETIKCVDRALRIFIKFQNYGEQEKLYNVMGASYKQLGNHQLAMEMFEKRLHIVMNKLQEDNVDEQGYQQIMKSKEGPIYGDIGDQHLELAQFEEAIHCFEQQLNFAKKSQDKFQEALAFASLGKCYQAMGDTSQALQYHEMDLKISQELRSVEGRARACNNVGLLQESLGNFEQALVYQEHHLNAATQLDDAIGKTIAFGSIGRIHHTLGNNIQAVAYLHQGLQLVEKLDLKEEEAKIRHFLGLALWRHGDLDSAQAHLEKSSDLLETIRLSVQKTCSEYSIFLFDKQIASYQALQRILVAMGRTEVALLVAEKSRTLANATLGSEMESSSRNNIFTTANSKMPPPLITSVDTLIQKVDRYRMAVLYYSVSGDYLYSWLIIPDRGVVKFNETCVNNDEETLDDQNRVENMAALIERYVDGTRDALGLDFNRTSTSDCDTEGPDLWSQHVEELGDKLNQENDKTGFLRMVSRSHRFNCSSYSLSSLFSVGSASGSVKSTPSSRPGSTRARQSHWQGPTCLRSLYNMFIAPFEEELNVLHQTCIQELTIVVETDLLLVPFPILRGYNNEEYLCEKFKLLVTPSISSIRNGMKKRSKNTESEDDSTYPPFVLGNPTLPQGIKDQWGWEDIPRAETEAHIVAEILETQPVINMEATKAKAIKELCEAEVIHLATHVSWKLSAIVLSPGERRLSTMEKSGGSNSDEDEDLPSFSEYLITAADILKLKLQAKFIILSCCHVRGYKHGLFHAESVNTLTKALLAAGAMVVLTTLWPVPETASKIFFRSLYSSLLQGSRVSHAVTEAMLTVQRTKHFAHPANWAGYLLMGSDVQISENVSLTKQAIWELLKAPDRSRDALRVTLHLVEKSLQRINNGQKNAMYTTQKSIENKVGNVSGWRDILMSVGFRFEASSNGLPAAVFFPQSDPGERLVKCSTNLQALLGLAPPSLHAVSKLLSSPEAGEDLISILRQIISEMATKDLENDIVEVKINVKLWGIVGCHELLASLGFDLIEVGDTDVILSAGKHVSSRMLQLALQACLALFGDKDEEKSLQRSHSLESIEFSAEDWCDLGTSISPSLQTAAYHSVRQQIAMGKGAFTSYVRSRGEPDGHTNCSADPKTVIDTEPKKFSVSPSTLPNPETKVYGKQRTYIRNVMSHVRKQPPPLSVRRADSSSSGSSMTDWESGLSTIKRREANNAALNNLATEHTLPGIGNVPSCSLSGFESQGSDTEFSQSKLYRNGKPSKMPPSKRVTWKNNEKHSKIIENGNTSGKSWLKIRKFAPMKQNGETTSPSSLPSVSDPESTKNDSTSVQVIHTEKPKQTHRILKSSQMSQMARELPISDVYHERNLGLGMAPPLSKLLFNNSLTISRAEVSNSGNKSDCEGALSMDDTISSFDHVSLVEDSVPSQQPRNEANNYTNAFKSMIPSSRRAQMGTGRDRNLGSKRPESSAVSPVKLNLKGLDNHGNHVVGSNSSSSSKSSPISDRRDEGDGRSLTDSQYGSYSPSMAQNDLIQTATAVYFCSRGDSSTGKIRERPSISEGDERDPKGDGLGTHDVSSKASSNNTYNGSEVSSTDSCGGKSSIVETEGRLYPSLEDEHTRSGDITSTNVNMDNNVTTLLKSNGTPNSSFGQKSSQC